MMKGGQVRGQARFMRADRHLRYHMADRNGWMYWCGCLGAMRLGGKVHYCVTGRSRVSGMGYWRRG